MVCSFLQVTGGSSVQSGWNSKPLALSTSVETLFPAESRAILIRNRNPLKDLGPNLFLVYLGYLTFILTYNQALLHSSGSIPKRKRKKNKKKQATLLPPRIYPQTQTSLCTIFKSLCLWKGEQTKEVLMLAGGKGEELKGNL